MVGGLCFLSEFGFRLRFIVYRGLRKREGLIGGFIDVVSLDSCFLIVSSS